MQSVQISRAHLHNPQTSAKPVDVTLGRQHNRAARGSDGQVRGDVGREQPGIRSPPSPNPDLDHNFPNASGIDTLSTAAPAPAATPDTLFGRILQRAKSTTGSRRSRRTSAPPEVDARQGLQLPSEHSFPAKSQDAGPTAGAVTQPQPQQATEQEPQHQHQHQHRRHRSEAAATANETVAKMPSATPQQPCLRKKSSIRDRLRWSAKPAPAPVQQEASQPKPRFVYEPKHAAADFSRLAVTTQPLRRRESRGLLPQDPVPPLGPPVGANTPEAHAKAKRRSQLQTLVENETSIPTTRRETRLHRHDEDSARLMARALQQSEYEHTTTVPRSNSRRQSHTLVDEPWHASPKVIQDPDYSDSDVPVPSTMHPRTKSRRMPNGGDDEHPLLGPEPPAPTSDFELFLARAEAEDRAHRELLWRNIAERSPSTAAPMIRPNPHIQFAAPAVVTPGSASADMSGTTAVAGRASAPSSSHGGTSHRTSGQFAVVGVDEYQQPARRGHRKHGSWATQTSAEKALERKRSLRGDEKVVSLDADGQPRTLRRQASITQRIADYIRPVRDLPGSGEATYEPPTAIYRQLSKSGLRRSGSNRRPIATVEE